MSKNLKNAADEAMATLRRPFTAYVTLVKIAPESAFVGLTFSMAWAIMMLTLMLSTPHIDRSTVLFGAMIPGCLGIFAVWFFRQRHVVEREFADDVIRDLREELYVIEDIDSDTDYI